MFEPKPNALSVNYAPVDGSVSEENPPVMVWLPENDYLGKFELQIANDTSFSNDCLVYQSICDYNFHRPGILKSIGTYFWRYRRAGQITWSQTRSFVISELSVFSELDRIDQIAIAPATAHPRLLVGNAAGFSRLQRYAEQANDYWQGFINHSVSPILGCMPHAEPQRYPNNLRDVSLWRKYYTEAQEAFYVIRHLAIAGQVTQNSEWLVQAKQWLLAIASWDKNGASSRHYNDEVGFRVIISLAWGYDWLFDSMSEQEQALVRDSLFERTAELYHHLTQHSKIHIFPYDSHAIRAISAALVPAAIALHGECDEAQQWLDFSCQYMYTLYSPWSGVDGGWGEGPHYWTTAMAYMLDAAQMLQAYLGVNLYQRPIIKNTGDFPLFTKSPGSRRGYFGDDSTLGEQATIKTAVCMLHLSGALDRSDYHWFYQQHAALDKSTGREFYNYGWWDTHFDRMLVDFYFDIPEPELGLPDVAVKWFKSIGWVSIQSMLATPEKHMQFTIKSSPLGSVSHSSADQGAFVLFGFEEDIAIHSGYYVSYGSTMHTQWRKQTKSKNTLLISRKGQYAGADKLLAKKASGHVVDVIEQPNLVKILTDNTPAYKSLNNDVVTALRDVYFVNKSYFLIVDTVESENEETIQLRQHSEQPFACSTSSMTTTLCKAAVDYSIAYSTAALVAVTNAPGFEDVKVEEYKGLDMNYVGEFSFAAAKKHKIVTLIQPYKQGEKKSLFTFVDDQGFNLSIYVTDEDNNSYRLEVPK